MFDTITLILLSWNQIQLEIGVKTSLAHQHEVSESILKQVKPSQDDLLRYHFYRLNNAFFQNNKEESLKHIRVIEYLGLQPQQERYTMLALLMQLEIEQWKDNDLGDVARDMKHVKDRFNEGINKKTIKLQEDIVSKLDKMIKEKEDELDKNKQKDDGDGQDGQSGKKPRNDASNPLEDSQLPQDGGKGTVNTVKMRQLMERWGSLPPREQARALQQLTEGLSPRHREAIENYFRNIANRNK